jgi:hypothetical protein
MTDGAPHADKIKSQPLAPKEKTAHEGAVFYLLVHATGTLRRDCLNAKPRPAKPSSIMAHVEGSGTPDTEKSWPDSPMKVFEVGS